MIQEQEKHLQEIISEFAKMTDIKYRKGQKEHGGDLWRKRGLIDMAIDEAIDQFIYLLSLKKQLQERGIELGELEERNEEHPI